MQASTCLEVSSCTSQRTCCCARHKKSSQRLGRLLRRAEQQARCSWTPRIVRQAWLAGGEAFGAAGEGRAEGRHSASFSCRFCHGTGSVGIQHFPNTVSSRSVNQFVIQPSVLVGHVDEQNKIENTNLASHGISTISMTCRSSSTSHILLCGTSTIYHE